MNEKKQQQEQIRTTIGGQALIEGIYMRGPQKQSVVVRNPEGELVEKVEDLKLIKDQSPLSAVKHRFRAAHARSHRPFGLAAAAVCRRLFRADTRHKSDLQPLLDNAA